MAEKREYDVTLVVDVPVFGGVLVEAESEEEAKEIVRKDIEKRGWDSPYWQDMADPEIDWGSAENLRVE